MKNKTIAKLVTLIIVLIFALIVFLCSKFETFRLIFLGGILIISVLVIALAGILSIYWKILEFLEAMR